MTRMDLRQRGDAVRTELGLGRSGEAEPVPGFDDFMAEVAFGGIWDRPHLARPDRMICALAALGLGGHQAPLEAHVASALDLGLPARTILEVFMQAGLYGGFVTTEAAARTAQKVFAARKIRVEADAPRVDTNETLDANGRAVMAKLHGDRAGQGYAAPDNPVTGALYPSAIRYGYGELWGRPGLDHRQRMLDRDRVVHRARPRGPAQEIRRFRAQYRALARGGHRGGDPDRTLQRLPARAERAGIAQRRAQLSASAARVISGPR